MKPAFLRLGITVQDCHRRLSAINLKTSRPGKLRISNQMQLAIVLHLNTYSSNRAGLLVRICTYQLTYRTSKPVRHIGTRHVPLH